MAEVPVTDLNNDLLPIAQEFFGALLELPGVENLTLIFTRAHAREGLPGRMGFGCLSTIEDNYEMVRHLATFLHHRIQDEPDDTKDLYTTGHKGN